MTAEITMDSILDGMDQSCGGYGVLMSKAEGSTSEQPKLKTQTCPGCDDCQGELNSHELWALNHLLSVLDPKDKASLSHLFVLVRGINHERKEKATEYVPKRPKHIVRNK